VAVPGHEANRVRGRSAGPRTRSASRSPAGGPASPRTLSAALTRKRPPGEARHGPQACAARLGRPVPRCASPAG